MSAFFGLSLRLALDSKHPSVSSAGDHSHRGRTRRGYVSRDLRNHLPANVKAVQAAFEDLRPGESLWLFIAAAACIGRTLRAGVAHCALLQPGWHVCPVGGTGPACCNSGCGGAVLGPFTVLGAMRFSSPDGTHRALSSGAGPELRRSECSADVPVVIVSGA